MIDEQNQIARFLSAYRYISTILRPQTYPVTNLASSHFDEVIVPGLSHLPKGRLDHTTKVDTRVPNGRTKSQTLDADISRFTQFTAEAKARQRRTHSLTTVSWGLRSLIKILGPKAWLT